MANTKTRWITIAFIDHYLSDRSSFVYSGYTGLIYAEIKRDYLILLWAVPFLIFLFLVGFVGFFYLILLIPLFSIEGQFIEDIVNKVNNKKNRRIINHCYFIDSDFWHAKY